MQDEEQNDPEFKQPEVDYNFKYTDENGEEEDVKRNIHGFKYPKRAREYDPWDERDDNKLLQLVHKSHKIPTDDDWKHIARKFGQHPFNTKKRYQYLNQPFVFTRQDEDFLVNAATKYFDDNQQPDWDAIGKQLRGKPAKQCEKRYYEVMREYWNDDSTKLLMESVQQYKLREEKIDWMAISRQLQNRPPRVLLEWYQIQQAKLNDGK